MSKESRQWVLKSRPPGLVGPEHFELKQTSVGEPGEGEILVRTLYLSFDPTQRGWLNEGPGYTDPVAIGAPMFGAGLGQVVKSNDPKFQEGDILNGMMPWQDYALIKDGGLMPLHKVSREHPLTWAFSVFGITTMTAYFGLQEVGQVKEGDVVLISGAAGATGSAVAEIAKIRGASKVIGVAGGPEKCTWIVGEGACDAAIDYKNDDIAARLKELAPDGVNVFYDNTGGPVLDAALANLADRARVVICGGIATGYSSWEMPEGPKNYLFLILKSARMEGFLLFNYMDRFPQAIADIGKWVQQGKLKVHETLLEGLENAPAALQGLFTGKNKGKTILKVADPD
ncbi:MAG: zinc-binding dehydrogenase [Alphaproteobacteria bacterium]|nr:zinc-binding dehydrogenase [Alphaproteobacteria bacterium]